MPRFQILPQEDEPYAEAFGQVGEVVGRHLQQRQQDDAVQRLINQYEPGMSRTDFLKKTLNTPGLPLEQRGALYEMFKGAEEEQRVLEEQKQTRSLKEQGLRQAAEKYQLPYEFLATLPPAELARILKESGKKEEGQKESFALLRHAGMPEDQALELSKSISPASARQMTKPPQFESTLEKGAGERINNYLASLEDASKNAQQDLITIDFLENLADQGATGPQLGNQLADYFQSKGINAEGLRNPLTKAYTAVSKSLLRGMSDLVKGKVSNIEFQTIMGMFAQAEDSPESAYAILQGQRMLREISIAENKLKDQILQEYADAGKDMPRNIQELTSERLKPIADEISRKTRERIKNKLNPKKGLTDEKRALMDREWNKMFGGK